MSGQDVAPGGLVLVIGESLVDIVLAADGTTRSAPGGSPANVAVGLSRLGVATELLTSLGDDAHGDLLRTHLASSGVTVRSTAPAAATSTAEARLDADGAADYHFSISWDPGTISTGAARLIHTGSLALCLRPGADEVLAALAGADPRTLVSIDPNLRPSLSPDREQARELVESAVRHAHVVKLSDEDMEWIYPGRRLEDVLARLHELGAVLAVVTRGARGCVASAPGWRRELAAQPASVVDTIGAGDSFMSGLLAAILHAGGDHGLLRGEVPQEQAEHWIGTALRSAAITVGRAGAQPPSAEELPLGA